MSWDLYSDLREQAQKRRFEEAVQVYIAKTPEQRVAYQKETDALFADYRKSPLNSGRGLIYCDGLLDRVAVVEVAKKRLSGKSEVE